MNHCPQWCRLASTLHISVGVYLGIKNTFRLGKCCSRRRAGTDLHITHRYEQHSGHGRGYAFNTETVTMMWNILKIGEQWSPIHSHAPRHQVNITLSLLSLSPMTIGQIEHKQTQTTTTSTTPTAPRRPVCIPNICRCSNIVYSLVNPTVVTSSSCSIQVSARCSNPRHMRLSPHINGQSVMTVQIMAMDDAWWILTHFHMHERCIMNGKMPLWSRQPTTILLRRYMTGFRHFNIANTTIWVDDLIQPRIMYNFSINHKQYSGKLYRIVMHFFFHVQACGYTHHLHNDIYIRCGTTMDSGESIVMICCLYQLEWYITQRCRTTLWYYELLSKWCA